MNPESLAEWLNTLSLAERSRALNRLGYELTISAREYALARTDPESRSLAVGRLIGINELHHKLFSQIGHYSDGEESRAYPVDVFSRSLFESAGHYGISPALIAGINYVRAKTGPPTRE